MEKLVLCQFILEIDKQMVPINSFSRNFIGRKAADLLNKVILYHYMAIIDIADGMLYFIIHAKRQL